MNARPAGAYVIHGDEVDWRPAVDPNKVIAAAVAALMVVRAAIRSREGRNR